MDESIIKELQKKRTAATIMGGPEAIRKLHGRGKLTPRERLDILLDTGSFVEIGIHNASQSPELSQTTPADGMVGGHGKIDGRIVFVTADDGSIIAGTRGRIAELKAARIRQLALKNRKPFVALMEAGAARVHETFGAIAAGLGYRFGEHANMSGVVPQVAGIFGACFGGPSFTAAQSDFVPMVNGTSFIGMSGPPIVKVGIGLDTTTEEIGGGKVSAEKTGQTDYLAENEEECLSSIRTFLSYFPSHCGEPPPKAEPVPSPLDTEEGKERIVAIVSENHRRAYNMEALVPLLADGGTVFQLKKKYARNVITALGRIQGEVVGFVANNPMIKAGAMDDHCIHKTRKFVELCDAFHIPLVFLQDCPGFIVGPEIEKQRMVSLAGRFLSAMHFATVPMVTIVLRKAVGLAYIALCGRAMSPDGIVAWPIARFDVMGPEAGVELVHGKAIAKSADPEKKRKEILAEIEQRASAYLAAEMGLIDDVIHPAETREYIIHTLARSRDAHPPRFKHRIDA